MLKVFITNLGMYNEGILCGEWIELPIEEEDLNEVLDKIKICHENENGEEVKYYDSVGNPYEEYFFTDFETDIDGLEIPEHISFEDLNEMAEEINCLDEEEQEVLSGLLKDGGYSYEDAISIINNQQYCVFYNCFDMSEVAEQVVEQCGYLDEMPEHLRSYFDYEAFGRDLEIEGDYVYCGKGVYIEIC